MPDSLLQMFQQESIRGGVQLVLIGLVGGALSLVYQRIKEDSSRQEAVRGVMRDLIKEIDELYRESKQIKRLMRFQKTTNHEGMSVRKKDFESGMKKLSEVQLALESCTQIIRTHHNLVSKKRCERIVKYISYSEKYFNKVVEEYESKKVVPDNEEYDIPFDCVMLHDFLGPRQCPQASERDFEAMEDDPEAAGRYLAWRRVRDRLKVVDASGGPAERRCKALADESLLLAIRDMRDAMLRPDHTSAMASFSERVRAFWSPPPTDEPGAGAARPAPVNRP